MNKDEKQHVVRLGDLERRIIMEALQGYYSSRKAKLNGIHKNKVFDADPWEVGELVNKMNDIEVTFRLIREC